VVRLKAVVDERMVGFIAADIRPSQRMAWIATIGVLPEYRGKGIGTGLLEACEQELQVDAIRLNVRLSNHTAIRLYKSLRYQQVGRWPHYYSDGEDALIMEKEIGHNG
jgi:ribosomal protein S18 acetylase RimI-like enzyme